EKKIGRLNAFQLGFSKTWQLQPWTNSSYFLSIVLIKDAGAEPTPVGTTSMFQMATASRRRSRFIAQRSGLPATQDRRVRPELNAIPAIRRCDGPRSHPLAGLAGAEASRGRI